MPTSEGTGDVKYHLGTSYDRPTISGKQVHLSLLANPSHLEVRFAMCFSPRLAGLLWHIEGSNLNSLLFIAKNIQPWGDS